MQPTTQYAMCGDLHIAYQVHGEGPTDLVYIRNWYSHVELMWQEPTLARVLNRLASFSRLIIFDQRGTGLSDQVPLEKLPTLEERMDDVRAVMEAAGSTRANVLGAGGAGPLAAVFAASHPDRCAALVLFNTFARVLRANDYPIGLPVEPEQIPGLAKRMTEHWGRPEMWQAAAQSAPTDERRRAWLESYNRMCLSPRAAGVLWRMNFEVDIREILPVIRVPTLVVHPIGPSQQTPPELGRYVAERIPGARYVEVESSDWSQVSPTAEALDEIQEFVTGVRPSPEVDRVLATVLFTDIVGSTRRVASIGDREWGRLLGQHNDAIDRCLAEFRGQRIENTGDGVLATFDGPARAVRCACAIRESVRQVGLEIRAGLHAGEIERVGDDVRGIAVHIGARVSAMAGDGEVVVSSTVKDLVIGSGLEFEDRGEHELKGVPGSWQLYRVKS